MGILISVKTAETLVWSKLTFSKLKKHKIKKRDLTQNVRIRNNKINFLLQKLESLHKQFFLYSKKYEKIYMKICKINQQLKYEKLNNWLRTNMHYQNFIQNHKNEEFTVDIKHSIPERFKDFLIINLSIRKFYMIQILVIPDR